MGKPAEYYLSKADLAVSDLVTSGGELVPAQAQRFIRLLIDESVLVKEANVVPMRSKKQLIETFRFGSRILRAATEGVALTIGDRSKPDLTKVELDVKLMRAEVRWSDEVIEDNIERGTLQNTILTEMANRAALDWDELIANGDTASADVYLAQFDGLRKTIATNVVIKAPIGSLQKGDFTDVLKAMPTEFQRDYPRMRWYTGINAVHDYRNTLSDRATMLGDRYSEQIVAPTPLGTALIGVPVFPENLGGGSNETELLLLLPKNMNVGFWRRIKVERDRDITAGMFIAVMSLRGDFKLTHEPATVKMTGVQV